MDQPATPAVNLFGETPAPAAPPQPPTPEPSDRLWVLLARDVEDVGRSGRVVQASPSRVAPWLESGDAMPATDAQVSIASPFHIILEN